MSELKRLEQEALRELAEKARHEHDVERVVNAARAYKESCTRPQGSTISQWEELMRMRRHGLFAALAVLDGEA